MAIITEEEPEVQTQNPKPLKSPRPTTTQTSTNPFIFWFYFTLIVSLITLFFTFLSSLSPQDPKTWFLNLPTTLRHHYSKGRIIKIQTLPNSNPIEVFSIEDGPVGGENLLLIHGLGLSSYAFNKVLSFLGSKGVHVVAVDLPGNGFSDKSVVVEEEVEYGVFEKFWSVYRDIKEKGVFWAFDHIIETGQMPYLEVEIERPKIVKRNNIKVLELGSEEMGRVLGQVIETLGLDPVHLVLHDSALSLGANWILNNVKSVRSVTLIDTSVEPALPVWVLRLPVIREVVLRFSFLYESLVKMFCVRGIGGLDADAHRVLLKGGDGGRAVDGMGRKLNHSFDIAEWGSSEGLIGVPMQVLWASDWSKEWTEEGDRIANALPQAKFIAHSGGRWPEENVADELAQRIYDLVSSLPKSVRQVEEEPIPEHIQKMFDEAKSGSSDNHLHHHAHDHHHSHDHGHVHMSGYPDAYGLGHGWAS